MRILEELCEDSDCKTEGTHWHPFSVADLLSAPDGEYTVTLRVRQGQGSRAEVTAARRSEAYKRNKLARAKTEQL